MKRAAALIAAAMIALAVGARPRAEAPDNSYTYGDTVLTRDGFAVEGVFYGADIGCGELNEPCDMFFTENETLLIADSGFASANGTGRILVTDKELKLIRSVERLDLSDMRDWLSGRAAALAEGRISEELYNKQTSASFNKPTGVFADKELVYAADSGNSRVVAFTVGNDGVGRVKRAFTLDGEEFTPLKTVADPLENVYVRVKGQNGAAVFTRDGKFRGSFGDGGFSNMDIDKVGYIFAPSDGAGSLMKLDPDGHDVFADRSVAFDETNAAEFADVDVSENGEILLLDKETGRLFLYNNECVPMFTFGGAEGTFEAPAAAEILGGRVYVLDGAKNSVTVFRPTEFGAMVLEAEKLLNGGELESSIEALQNILKLDPSFTAAHVGIGAAYLKSGDAAKAMEHLKGRSESLYSEAFKQRRRELLRGNFTPMALTVLAAVAAVCVVSAVRKKRNSQPLTEKSRTLRIMRYPADGFFELRMENAYHLPTALIILALFFAASALSENFTGAVRNVLLFLMWVTANKAVCVLLGGIGSVKAVFVSFSYALCPLIIGKLVNIMLSFLLASDERAPIVTVSVIAAIYSFIMLFEGMREAHRYTFRKTVFTMLLSVAGTGVIVVTATVLVTLVERVWLFFRAVFTDILYRVPSLTAPALALIFIGAIAVIVGLVCGAYALCEKIRRKKPRGE